MERRSFRNKDLNLSYLDSGGSGPVLIALHAHWMEGKTFEPFAEAMGTEWRVIALDQRGHGYSDHATTYTRRGYLTDLTALFEHLQAPKAVLLGNSLGGVNAYQFAAAYPACVRALIIEDIGVVIADDINFSLAWSGTFATYEELAVEVGPRFLPYLKDSIRHEENGWRMAFDPQDMVESQNHLNGDHWREWLSSRCPALLIRGQESRVTNQDHMEDMAARRRCTDLVVLPGGHIVHLDSPEGFTKAVREFLDDLRN